ncbi:MAG: thioesterase [Pseudooceanicola sp.]|jgi:acyl-CoA thioester hydrolase|nr:thioesterase [Pseudooceanicola sp.]
MAVFTSSPLSLEPAWIDHNGHLNMAFYSVLFDRGVDQVWDNFGLGLDYVKTSGMTTFAAEFHVRYVRELKLGDLVTSTFQILDHDAKRVHSFQELRHVDGWLAATGETLHLSIDQSGPRVAAFPDDVQARIAAMAQDHADLPHPDGAGRRIGLRQGA